MGSFAMNEIGKSLFLTQAEAEQKLKEMEMKASSGYSAERVSAFSRAIEIVKHCGVGNDVD